MAAYLVLVIAERWLSQTPASTDPSELSPAVGLSVIAAMLLFAVVGAVVAASHPRNAIGWIFCAVALVEGIRAVASAFARSALQPDDATAAAAAMLVVRVGAYLPIGLALFGLLLFPTGALPSRRWRPVAVAAGVFIATHAVTRALGPFAASSGITNPIGPGEPWSAALRELNLLLFPWVWSGLLVLAVSSLIFRSRDADVVQRQQLKWFVYASTLGGAIVATFWLLGGWMWVAREPVWLYSIVVAVYLCAIAAIPVGAGIAILRYRLFDIDLLINRTMVYAAVTAGLLALFIVGSAAAHRLLEGVIGQGSEITTPLVALVVALAFGPLRRQIRPVVDRFLPGRLMLALLFTDIVDSTETATTLGDERWRVLLARYRTAVRRALAEAGGHEVDTAGDGFFATFDRPAAALRAARAIHGAVREFAIESRTGLHLGECEMRGEKVSGIAVNTAARVMTAARPGEIVVSAALRAVLADANLDAQDLGMRRLKGLPGELHLYAIGAG